MERKIEHVVVVGAGPYGLSIAAHLHAAGVRFRIFGAVMASWRMRMPGGMFLKSEGCASSISDPNDSHTLQRYCAEIGADYQAWGLPVSLGLFRDYGHWFQKHLVPQVEETTVVSCRQSGDVFELGLENGERVECTRVVVATGLTGSARLPFELAHLPDAFISHSSAHRDFARFRDREVIVLGGGQSALETAALLQESGARPRLVARRSSLVWGEPPRARRSLYERLRHPMSKLGPGLRTWVYGNSPAIFYRMPEKFRIKEAQTVLGPAGAWWLKSRVVGHMPIMLGHDLRGAELSGGRVVLCFQQGSQSPVSVSGDHIIAATGYQVTAKSFPFLAPGLVSQIRCLQQAPVLSRNFESSVPGLYFVGNAAMYQFGPVMRFVAGTEYVATRLAWHLGAGGRSMRRSEKQSALTRSDDKEVTIAR